MLRAVPGQLRLTADGVLVLYGADFSGLYPGVAAAVAADPVSYRIAVTDFGRPMRIYHFGGHTIMI